MWYHHQTSGGWKSYLEFCWFNFQFPKVLNREKWIKCNICIIWSCLTLIFFLMNFENLSARNGVEHESTSYKCPLQRIWSLWMQKRTTSKLINSSFKLANWHCLNSLLIKKFSHELGFDAKHVCKQTRALQRIIIVLSVYCWCWTPLTWAECCNEDQVTNASRGINSRRTYHDFL